MLMGFNQKHMAHELDKLNTTKYCQINPFNIHLNIKQ